MSITNKNHAIRFLNKKKYHAKTNKKLLGAKSNRIQSKRRSICK